jgi:CRP-like cAMP-binding protein
MATVKAIEDCAVMRLEKAAMLGRIRDEPAFSKKFMSHLLARTIRVEEDTRVLVAWA